MIIGVATYVTDLDLIKIISVYEASPTCLGSRMEYPALQ